MSSEKFLSDKNQDDHNRLLYTEKLEQLRQLVWETISQGYSFDELSDMLESQEFSIDCIVSMNDGINGGEYWRLAASQFNRTSPEMIEYLEIERLLPAQDGTFHISSIRYTFDTVNMTLQEEFTKHRNETEYTNVASLDHVNILMERINDSAVVDLAHSKKIQKKHQATMRHEIPNA